MATNSDIVPTNKSAIIPVDKESSDIMPGSNDSNLGDKSGKPSIDKILVTYDGSEKSDKAINYSIYLPNISKAEIVILQVIGNIDKLENSSIDISNKYDDTISSNTKYQNYSVNIDGKIVKSMEDKIKEIESAGFKNRVSYKIRPGFIPDEIVKEINESKYDLLIISSSHMDSWINSLFSQTRKIIGNVDLPILLLH
ncbi:universal stress protein [Candidatus Nitrosocosmicus hydrocola]|uniref:universal stress protein n=1 Tax=Candidatus Nitrosocosmicus hydrocola TaxID=1826872 RepID=UPI0011E5F977|nr:universal stress protein [Candidatus Nitrosocosmicus hydrocola]